MARKRKRSRKSWEQYRRKLLDDLRHMLRCCQFGRLPEGNCEYLQRILLKPQDLPSAREIAKELHFTNAQREQNKLWTIPPIDVTKEQLAAQRREKDRHRKMLARRRARMQTRAHYLAAVASQKLWLKEDKSERTWYRHQAKARAAALAESSSAAQMAAVAAGMSRPQN